MFTFKRFAVAQGGAAMKVGTDGVLLGAWCPMGHKPARVLDIGTGTGLIALMAAQRGEAWGCVVDAVDIDSGAAAQAHENFVSSPWAERLNIMHRDARSLCGSSPYRYGLIVSNPPFFSDSLVSPDARRAMARHTATLTYSDLAQCVAAVLDDDGLFATIVPHDHAASFIGAATLHKLHLHCRLDVFPTPAHPPRRSLLSFGRTTIEPVRNTLTIEVSRHNHTAEYRNLTREFYLKF